MRQTRYQAECIISGWEDSRLTPPECEYPDYDDDPTVDDDVEDRWCEKLWKEGL